MRGTKIEREVARRFKGDVRTHELTVLQDDGVHRHLRFAGPDTGMYWIEIVTWPGSLYVGGDMDGFVFSRLPDMFEFFRGDGQRINPHYWSEKLVAPAPGGGDRRSVKVFSPEAFRATVLDTVRWAAPDYPRGLRSAVIRDVIDHPDAQSEDGARMVLDAFEWPDALDRKKDDPVFQFTDTWEMDFRDWGFHFLWACHAIVWGIAYYDAHKAGRKVRRPRAPKIAEPDMAIAGKPVVTKTLAGVS